MRAARVRRCIAVLLTATAVSGCGDIVELEPGNPARLAGPAETTIVVAADGSRLARLHGEEDRRTVALEHIAPVLRDAVVAIEDRRFYQHAGVDLTAIGRAAVRNVDEGAVVQGGSTITQQYVKNTVTGSEQTLARKIREAALAYQLEQHYTKDEILERYLNTVFFGRGAYGVAAAARRYFDRGPDRLTLAQAALLAGLVAAPSRFDPYEAPDTARDRRGLVLDAMVANGHVDRDRAERAAAEPLVLAPPPPPPGELAPGFLAEVKRRLQHDAGRFGVLGDTVDLRADALFTDGLRVVTTLDPATQAAAEHAVRDVVGDRGPAAAVVVTDPRSGAVRALVGGRGHQPATGFNLATQGRRQPGSAFKPVVLAAALARGVPLDRRFPGEACATFDDVGGWSDGVCNDGGRSGGTLTLRDATVHSVNTVFARLAVEMGTGPIVRTAGALGLGGLPDVPSVALGAGEVTPLALAGAYGAFAAGGRRHEPYLVERIETRAGEILYRHRSEGVAVLDDAIAAAVTQTLADAVARGTGVRARIDRPQAGKTGTSQRNADAWFVGYTPTFLATVWIGFPHGRVAMVPPATPEPVSGGGWPAEIWRQIAQEALADRDLASFPRPTGGLVAIEVDPARKCLPTPFTPRSSVATRTYAPGAEPTRTCPDAAPPPPDPASPAPDVDPDGLTSELSPPAPDPALPTAPAMERAGAARSG